MIDCYISIIIKDEKYSKIVWEENQGQPAQWSLYHLSKTFSLSILTKSQRAKTEITVFPAKPAPTHRISKEYFEVNQPSGFNGINKTLLEK